jgi:hypothetical protein
MWALYTGIAAAVLIGVASSAGMLLTREPVYQAQPMDSVRVGDPGHNLVGRDWTGNPSVSQSPDGAAGRAEAQVE